MPVPQDADEPQIVILMAVFNGGAYLQDQLDSFARQTHADWRLIVSDDGSTDDSLAILDRFAAEHPVHIQAGPGQGFAANFLALLGSAPKDAAFVALSDQDDVWFDARLERGRRALEGVDDATPALYCARTVVVDQRLTPLHETPLFVRPAAFPNALVQSLGGGNTMMLNRAALDLVGDAAAEAGPIVAHDWWLYQIIAGCGGTVINDPEPVLNYRQHGGNQIGANRSAAARWDRLKQVLQGRYSGWHDTNIAALNRSSHRMTVEAQHTLHRFQAARSGGLFRRLGHLWASGVYRQSRVGTAALFVACLMGRL